MNLPVMVNGITVTQAIVEEIDGQVATVFIPATRFKMGVTYSLTTLDPETDRAMAAVPQQQTTSEAADEVNNGNNANPEGNTGETQNQGGQPG